MKRLFSITGVLRCLLVFALLIVALGFTVPHLAADRFRAGAQKALETSLGRKVEVGGVKYNLFTGPGFTISKVVIYDDPALSAEPILYAEALTAIPRILPLFAGKLAFSSIRFEDAHINLGRTASPDQPARWNVEPLVRPALFQAFPNISVESGGVRGIPKSRINFKIGGVKTVFYLLIDRLEVRPPSSGNGPWNIRLEGEPARADRPALGFGSFVADGRWTPSKGLADINIRLERSEVGDMIALLNGHDAGVHGSVSGQARIAGPLTFLRINGRVDVRGLHGWDQLPSSQDWPLAIAGTWNLPGQLFELNSRLAGEPDSPVQAHFRVGDYLGAPHWGLGLSCKEMPLQPLLPLARQIGLPIPDGVQLNGTLDGAVSFSRTGPLEGSASAAKTSLTVAGAPPLEFDEARLIIAGGHAQLAQSSIRTTPTDDATIQADYDLNRHSFKVTLTSRGMDIAGLHPHANLAAVPALRDLQSGSWKGQLSYAFDPETALGGERNSPSNGWKGSADLQRAVMTLPWLASPVRLTSAHVEMDGTSVAVHRIQARSGDLAVAGDYHYDAPALRPHRFHLVSGSVRGEQLEALFRPAFYRGGMVSRALGLAATEVPAWLAAMRADGTIEIGSLDLGGLEFDHVSSRVIWDGARVKLAGTKARYEDGTIEGLINADISGRVPAYHGAGQVKGIAWKGGEVDADLSLDTFGTGVDTLANLRSEGSFRAHDVDIEFNSMGGCFQFAWSGRAPVLKLTSLTLSNGEETFVGSGATVGNGELLLDLAGVPNPVRLTLR